LTLHAKLKLKALDEPDLALLWQNIGKL